ncbi:MAG: glycoside hydrolase family 88 protein, partial [Alistipes sp.]|nr:glycoside hydrolase family 88 protein [Alistipes sp.]
MKLKPIYLSTALLLLLGMWSCVEPKQEVQNDSNTPLHLLQPAYNTPYGPLTVEEIKADLDRV